MKYLFSSFLAEGTRTIQDAMKRFGIKEGSILNPVQKKNIFEFLYDVQLEKKRWNELYEKHNFQEDNDFVNFMEPQDDWLPCFQ